MGHALVGGRNAVLLVVAEPGASKATELSGRLDFQLGSVAEGSRPEVVVSREAPRLLDFLRYRAIAVGDQSLMPRLLSRVFSNVYNVDYECFGADGWTLARLGSSISRRSAASRRTDASRFRSVILTLQARRKTCAYLFGTGPSLSRASGRVFDDGYIVVCNTIVRDSELWSHLSPDVLVAGDAIYHFGHTPHARAFRADALARLRESRGATHFVYPDIFDHVVRSEFADVSEQLHPVPFGEHADVTVDLAKTFALPDLGNVLNLLLLPIGCTLSRDVRLWGFDGRAPKDAFFWANSGRHSYSELMDGIRAAHPAFFTEMVPVGRESQYVESVHGSDLDLQLSSAERRGFAFTMLHHSWTPTLSKRCPPGTPLPSADG